MAKENFFFFVDIFVYLYCIKVSEKKKTIKKLSWKYQELQPNPCNFYCFAESLCSYSLLHENHLWTRESCHSCFIAASIRFIVSYIRWQTSNIFFASMVSVCRCTVIIKHIKHTIKHAHSYIMCQAHTQKHTHALTLVQAYTHINELLHSISSHRVNVNMKKKIWSDENVAGKSILLVWRQ